MNKGKKVFYFDTFNEDVIESADQDFKLSDDYKWINDNIFVRIGSWLIYILAIIIGTVYCRLGLLVTIKNKKAFKEANKSKKGYFIFANHTQPVGDVFIPALACIKRRVYVMVSTANYGIQVIGKILPMLGALPVPESLSGFRKFNAACNKRIEQKRCVVVYPEAHVWPYYTGIRPFAKTSFKFPCELDVPSYCITTTYRKSKLFKRPKAVVYVDGPFYPDKDINMKARQTKLHDEIYAQMSRRSEQSNYEFYQYIKK